MGRLTYADEHGNQGSATEAIPKGSLIFTYKVRVNWGDYIRTSS